MTPSTRYQCPVCGYALLKRPPRDGRSASDEICPSCGYQFGYTDDDLDITYVEWRRRWVAQGMPFRSEKYRGLPKDWDPVRQLAALEREERAHGPRDGGDRYSGT